MLEQGTFTDPRDGASYPIVKLRDGKWWLAENLRFAVQGSFPPDEKPDESLLATNPSYDWRRYGRLYTWEAAQKAPPPGWRLPSDKQYQAMLNAYGGFAPLHGDIAATGRNDLLTLIRDELTAEFGGYLNAANHCAVQPGSLAYGYFGGFMGARFWTSSRPMFDRTGSALYYLLFLRHAAHPSVNEQTSWSHHYDEKKRRMKEKYRMDGGTPIHSRGASKAPR